VEIMRLTQRNEWRIFCGKAMTICITHPGADDNSPKGWKLRPLLIATSKSWPMVKSYDIVA
jgi:hypothetical protein